ncbi:hypothetical protein GOB94_12325 [Granulicella sp. 5B5]|uniref:hypothetical protein n=1 Tax=Granulicella sp. 5B5 TaxID=1617967 RepID=UPI0015F72179|nr:hypothetical protein [Granulicella sp. 5B5]QMV19378.1 hypothetical protein GOB94_12325 [Granulicella sp. 5B5]
MAEATEVVAASRPTVEAAELEYRQYAATAEPALRGPPAAAAIQRQLMVQHPAALHTPQHHMAEDRMLAAAAPTVAATAVVVTAAAVTAAVTTNRQLDNADILKE